MVFSDSGVYVLIVKERNLPTTAAETEGLSICMVSIHGLIRGHEMELGYDADTGGQTKYVVDLVRALEQHAGVDSVDLITRRIDDPAVSEDYAQAEEQLCEGVRIIRIDCGSEEYIPKEQLWGHLDAFTDNVSDWLSQQVKPPSLIHSHYADSGYVGVKLSNQLGIPLIHTGHSLGRDKRKRLLAAGVSQEDIEQTYNISRRVAAEESVLDHADLVVASTYNEINEQYGLYNHSDPTRMIVIPPGTNLNQFRPCVEGEYLPFQEQVDRFYSHPGKPIILALSRADERKNILTLLEVFGESPELQEAANLLIVVGNRSDIRELDDGAQTVLTNILIWVDTYDLYGKVALPKHHRASEVPEIYRLVAASGGVFINPALTEPFGLTLLEAAATGLPLVATENGGPVDIIENCHNGKLVNPLDKDQITEALLHFVVDRKAWKRASRNGIEGTSKHYSWQSHVATYVSRVRSLTEEHVPLRGEQPIPQTLHYRNRMIVTDLDKNLLGDAESLRHLVELLKANRKRVSFCVATGRRLDSALALMKKLELPHPDVLITSLGTRIHYGQALKEDGLWIDNIDHCWSPRRIRSLLSDLPGLKLQDLREQTSSKISFDCDAEAAPSPSEIQALLLEHQINANVTLSSDQHLDVVPSRASKGKALRYVAQRLEIRLDQVLVAGGGGADEDMMWENTLAVVVKNRHREKLSLPTEVDRVYFAEGSYAAGILEGIDHYDFLEVQKEIPDSKLRL
jgi:sucrose-phosphate synthase